VLYQEEWMANIDVVKKGSRLWLWIMLAVVIVLVLWFVLGSSSRGPAQSGSIDGKVETV
jgi:bacteriorhodopsin